MITINTPYPYIIYTPSPYVKARCAVRSGSMLRSIALVALVVSSAAAQTTARSVTPHLSKRLHPADVVAAEIRQYLMQKAPALPSAASAEAWTAEATRLRRRFLDEVVFHGWPREWVAAPLKVEDLGPIPSGAGYRMRKLRYEIVPGFWSTAILYEPEKLVGRVPAILNVNGHVGAPGKSVEYKQKRCVQQARMGIVALNLEWLAFGELSARENQHWFAAHLDLVGANGLGIFYLAMRKGLDYLAQHPNVDPKRLGVTGLSGGGWQTVVLSGLDERAAAAAPVAGYSALVARIERTADTGDLEQNATDMATVLDYPHLTAMRAPRPTLLIYNAEDDCCFRAPLVKPDIFDALRPLYRLYGAEDRFAWHENTDPADHNYQLDNRMQSYRFFARYFELMAPEQEEGVAAEVRSYDELVVGLPKDNLTILGLARRFANEIRRAPAERSRLREVLRYRPVEVRRAWALNNTKSKELETRSYRLEFSNGLSVVGVWLRAIYAPESAPATILLDDRGKSGAGAEVSERVNRGENVFAVDLLFTGDAAPQDPGPAHYSQIFAAVGDRPLGLQAAQLVTLAEWVRKTTGARVVRLESSGMRSQMTALAAAAMAPDAFSEAVLRQTMPSLRHLLDTPVEYRAAPELFCLDLYKEFDVESLIKLASPVRITL